MTGVDPISVESLATLGFRNLAPGEIKLGPAITLLWGPNGAGKTNLLEALYFALAGRSPRTRNDRELIAFGEPLARAEAVVAEADEQRTFLCAVARSPTDPAAPGAVDPADVGSSSPRRRHLVDGSPVGPEAAELRPPISVFIPDRLALVKGPPAARRSHLDRFCAALWPARAEARRRYARALAQRNALLGRVRSGIAAEDSLEAWEIELASAGVALIAARTEATALLAPGFERAGSELGLPGSATLAYRPRSETTEAGELTRELAERRAADVARGYTGWGPHLDELALALDGRALRRYGSQGQQRAALLALLFAEREALIGAGRPAPLMLLDDVTSELDGERRLLLCARLAAGAGQAILTAAEPDQLPAEAARAEIAIRAGHALGALEAGSARADAA